MSHLVDVQSIVYAMLPEFLLCGGALIMLLASVWEKQGTVHTAAEGAERTGVVTAIGLVTTAATMALCIWLWAEGAPGSSDGRIAADAFRWGMDVVILLGVFLTLILVDADNRRSALYAPEVPVLVVLAASGMMVMAGARDLMFVFLGLELMSIAVYVLAGSNRRSPRSAESGMKYFLLGAFSAGFLLYGMALIFGAVGSTRFADIGAYVASQGMTTFLYPGIALLLVGFGFKVALVPFHLWTPDVYDGAPLPVTAFMAASVKTAAFAAFARLLLEGFSAVGANWHAALWWIAALTMITGNVMALAQKNLVRMLAYSSIAHAGYLLVAIVVNSDAGMSALLFYVLAYTLATMGTFGVIVIVSGGRFKPVMMDDMAGLWYTRPGLAISMTVFLLAFLGFPLLGGAGFFAKWYLLQAMLETGSQQNVLAVILVVTSVVSAGYYLGVASVMYMRRPAEGRTLASGTPGVHALVTVSAVLLLILGVYPTPVMNLARRATVHAAAGISSQPHAPVSLVVTEAAQVRTEVVKSIVIR